MPENFEIRDFEPYTKHYDDNKVASYLSLEKTKELQMKSLKYNQRRKINKAYKNGLSVSYSNEVSDIKLFYKVYCKNMLRLGSPVLSEKFFLNLLATCKDDDSKVFLIKLKGKVVGGAIVIGYKDFVEDCWLSTLKEYNKLYASDLLYWEMIVYCIEKNKKYFSLGRSTKNSGLLNFKSNWNTTTKTIYFSYSHKKKFNIKKLTFLTNLWKYLPLKLANHIGPKISEKIY